MMRPVTRVPALWSPAGLLDTPLTLGISVTWISSRPPAHEMDLFLGIYMRALTLGISVTWISSRPPAHGTMKLVCAFKHSTPFRMHVMSQSSNHRLLQAPVCTRIRCQTLRGTEQSAAHLSRMEQ